MGKKIKRVPAKKIANRIINNCDIVIMVLDARNPEHTRNRKLENEIKKLDKKLIYVLNKSDLVPLKVLYKWKKNIKDENPNANVVFVSSKNKEGTRILRDTIKKYIQLKGIKEGKVGVIGYPNVGKSSLINALTGKKSAASGLVAGLTKGEQWIKLTKNIKLFDTPGVIEAKDEDDLVIIGALRYEKIENPVEPAIKILKNLHSFDNNIIKNYYNIDLESDEINEETIKKIGEKLNYLGRNGVIDVDRAAKSIIKDYQDGKLNYYWVKSKKYGQKRKNDINFITKYLKDFPFIDDANSVIAHLSEINELSSINLKQPRIGFSIVDGTTVVISFGEKTADSGRKKVEEYAKANNIELYSKGKGKCGRNRLYVGVGEPIGI